ncbi:MAG: AMP-binding protein [Proteobacteria bacterium]|nr:AMP-binding protein [Pseudomonadota bacterium]
MRFADADDIAAFARVPIDERLAGRDLLAMLREQAMQDGNAPALLHLRDGVDVAASAAFSRRMLLEGVQAIVQALHRLGVKSGDVVASLLPNGPGAIAASLAAMAVGRLAPINLYLEDSQVGALLTTSGATVLMVPREVPEAIAGMLAALQTRQEGRTIETLVIDTSTLASAQQPAPEFAPRALSEHVALFHTGGTTGLPKFVPLTARNISAGAVISGFAYGYRAGERVLCAMPMFHVGGLFACSLFALAAGSEVVILGPLGYRGEGVVAALPNTISTLDLSVVVGPPTIMAQLAARPPERTRTRLRLFINGAAALPSVVGTRLSEATCVPVVEPWGLTEATLAVTCGPRDGRLRQGSVGLALPYCEVKAVRTDADGVAIGDCAADEIGVLTVRGPMVFDGYLGRATDQQPFFPEGWLDSGDLGRVDPDGFIWVTGRAKELIKRGGHGIDPSMIENALSAHPAVALAAAVGKPDAYAGELPVAYVELRPGRAPSAQELIDFAQARIPERAAVPKDVIVVPKLPITPIGKVHKQTLKLDITRRVTEQLVRALIGQAAELSISVEPHALYGLEVEVRVAPCFVAIVRDKLAELSFRSRVDPLEKDDPRMRAPH